MYRTTFEKRPDFAKQFEIEGMSYHERTWSEGTCYLLKDSEVNVIKQNTNEAYNMLLEMARTIVKSGDYPAYFGLSNIEKEAIEQSWNREDPSLLGRFDFAYSGPNEMKLLEFNGDTPVTLLETAVSQRDYLKVVPIKYQKQFNDLETSIVRRWKQMYPQGTRVHFATSGTDPEDLANLDYLSKTAVMAGMKTKQLSMEDIGLVHETSQFVDLEEKDIENIFKLYPWEWMMQEGFGQHVVNSTTNWLEPAWKMLLSNKGSLVKLWDMFKGHSLLLPAYANESQLSDGYWCKKTISGRVGQNISKVVRKGGVTVIDELAQGSVEEPLDLHWGYIYQQWTQMPVFNDMKPVLGSWIVGKEAAGISFREDQNDVTGNDAKFICHAIDPDF